jgi:ketosteroid isomerase-like protein
LTTVSRAVETVRAAFEAFNRRDWGAALKDAHPDFELKTPDGDPLSATYRGPEGARQFYEELLEPFEEFVSEPREFFEGDDRVVVFAVARLRPRGSSATMELTGGQIWTIRDGKLARCELFRNGEQALAASGLGEDARVDAG